GPKTPIWVTSVPPGADVFIDTVPVGRAPMEGRVDEGVHTFAMTLEGYRPWSKRQTFFGQAQLQLEARLAPLDDDLADLPPGRADESSERPDAVSPAADDGMRHRAHWPIGSFSLWPRAHTVELSRFKPLVWALEP